MPKVDPLSGYEKEFGDVLNFLLDPNEGEASSRSILSLDAPEFRPSQEGAPPPSVNYAYQSPAEQPVQCYLQYPCAAPPPLFFRRLPPVGLVFFPRWQYGPPIQFRPSIMEDVNSQVDPSSSMRENQSDLTPKKWTPS